MARFLDDQVAREILDELLNPDLPLERRLKRLPEGEDVARFVELMARISFDRDPGFDLLTIRNELAKMAAAILQSCQRDRSGEVDNIGAGARLGIVIGVFMAIRYVALSQAAVDEMTLAAQLPDDGTRH